MNFGETDLLRQLSHPPRPSTSSHSSSFQIRASLLEWYDANHRVLPWRRNPHSKLPKNEKREKKEEDDFEDGAPLDLPLERFIYGVWVCEVMSQQTQLDRVKAYWRTWMRRWPDVAALAAATEDEVREAWAGLGYYRRAAFLLKGARYVAEELGGAFPREEEGLKKIPGVGAYTSAAIASIACGRRVAVVDGNVMRVLSRLRALAVADPKAAAAAKQYATLADSLVDPERPGDFNQAVMELGATVCVPNTRPNCSKCPVRAHCAARAQEIKTQGSVSVTDFPTKSEKAAKREETVDVCVVEVVHSSASSASSPSPPVLPPSVLLQKRPEGGLLAGLWEFPSVAVSAAALAEKVKKTSPASSRRAAVDEHVSRLLGGVSLPSGDDASASSPSPSSSYRLLRREQLGEIVHVFSHIRMTLSVEHVRLEISSDSPSSLASAILGGEEIPADDGEGLPARRWVAVSEMAEERVSSSVAKCWKLVSEGKCSSVIASASVKRAAPVDPEAARKETGEGIKRFFQPAVKKAV